jgi:hypothetical protein
MKKITRFYFCLLLAGGAFLTPLIAQDQLDKAEQEKTIDSLVQALSSNYVFPKVAEEMGQHLKNNWEAGNYRSLTDPYAFADRLTADIQSISHDKHLRVNFDPQSAQRMRQAHAGDEDEDHLPPGFLKNIKRHNYGFEEVKILEGNVGYLDLRGFLPPEFGGETATAVMNYLSNADAIIFDLRRNGGGSPGMIQLLTSYLYPAGEPVHLNNFYYRPGNDTSQTWTLPYVPGKRNPEAEVYVLTSGRTFSAAEEFTYNLKNLERGTIVGETTGGGAHPGGSFPIADSFVAFIATGRAINPITNTNWEGAGVTPHVEVSSEAALEKAHLMALEKLAEKAEDEQDRRYYSWHADFLRARLEPVTVSPETLKSYAGQYGPRRLSFEEGRLTYQREGRPKLKLVPLNPTTFVMPDHPEARIRIEVEDDKTIALIVEYDNGHKERSPRSVP